MIPNTIERLKLIDKAWQLLTLDVGYEVTQHIFWNDVSEDIQNLYLTKVKELN